MNQPNFQIKTEEDSKDHGVFVLEPLPEGYGHTLGNSLRRVLLSSLPGAAITSVKISGVNHQFSTLDGLREDIVELILNLKKVRVKYTGDKPVKLSLEVKGEKKVTAAEIDCPAGVEVVNKDLYLATLSEGKTKLDVEMTVEAGFGYSLADERKSDVIGLIPVDALYTPVNRVNYKVEATRVGRMTNFDKLIIEIYTDGTVKPSVALKESAKILVSFFQQVVNPVVVDQPKPSDSGSLSVLNQNAHLTVDELDLPTRIANALKKAGVETVADLLATPREEIAKTKNLGEKSLKIIELSLKDKDIELPS